MAQAHQVTRCPTCGKPRLQNEPVCGSCGHKWFQTKPSAAAKPGANFGVPPVVSAPVSTQPNYHAPIPTNCPLCSSGSIQRVTGVVASQSQSGMSAGFQSMVGYSPGTGVIGMGGPTGSYVQSSTDLARYLAPPLPIPLFAQKSLAGPITCIAFGLMFSFCGGLCFVRTESKPDPAAGTFWLLVAAGLLGTGCYMLWQAWPNPARIDSLNAPIAANNARRYQIWERCYYCPRCDMVWDAATGSRTQTLHAQGLWS